MRGECYLGKLECPLFPDRCFSNTHHIFGPHADFKTKDEKKFLNLPENEVQKCFWEHTLINAGVAYEPKPSRDVILQAIHDSAINIHPPMIRDIMPPLPYKGLDYEPD